MASKLIDDASTEKRLLEKRNAKRSIFVALTAAATAILRNPDPLRLPCLKFPLTESLSFLMGDDGEQCAGMGAGQAFM